MPTLAEAQAVEESNPKVILRSRMEGSVIRDFARQAGLATYVDLGCWVGLLARESLQSGDFQRAVLVDAVGTCLQKTSDKLAPFAPRFAAEYHQVAIVTEPERRQFQVPAYDTSCAGFGQGGLTLDVSQVEIDSFVRSLKLDLAQTYLKVDLEGLDLKVAQRLHQARLLPRVLHVEFSGSAEFDYLQTLLGESYAFPQKQPGHAFYSMALSRERGVLIGFDPDFAYL
jgi:hypothetical protein